ncbi:hypothetical protein [Paenibacillus humicus]|uniref:hypothetical protein n=1 Tax=Paenibacillus humicus TaxID=412861 RepID=UPI003F5CEF18
MLEAPREPITEAGVRLNLSVGLNYIEAWLRGTGAVPINSLMEDDASAKISRAQLWQWIRHPEGNLEDGRKMSADLYRKLLDEELAKLQAAASLISRIDLSARTPAKASFVYVPFRKDGRERV